MWRKLPVIQLLFLSVLGTGFFISVSRQNNPRSTIYTDNFEQLAQALEAYALDNNGQYPSMSYGPATFIPKILSTPIAYISKEATIDPMFPKGSWSRDSYWFKNLQNLPPTSIERQTFGSWIISSRSYLGTNTWPSYVPLFPVTVYDASNGTYSAGAVFRSQLISSETGVPEIAQRPLEQR